MFPRGTFLVFLEQDLRAEKKFQITRHSLLLTHLPKKSSFTATSNCRKQKNPFEFVCGEANLRDLR